MFAFFSRFRMVRPRRHHHHHLFVAAAPRSRSSSPSSSSTTTTTTTAMVMVLFLWMPVSAMVVSSSNQKNQKNQNHLYHHHYPQRTLAEAAAAPSSSSSSSATTKEENHEKQKTNQQQEPEQQGEEEEEEPPAQEFWKTPKGREFLRQTLAKTTTTPQEQDGGEKEQKLTTRSVTSLTTSVTNSMQGWVHNVQDKVTSTIRSSSSSSSSSDGGSGFAGLAASFATLFSSRNNDNDDDTSSSLDTIMAQVTNSAQQGQGVTDTAGFTKLLSVMHDNSDQIQQILVDQFGHIDFSFFTPAALWYYLEYEDERKNPSWKRLQHRFHESVDITMVEDLNDSLALAELSYADTTEQLQEGLKKLTAHSATPLELIYYQVESSPSQPSHFVAIQKNNGHSSSSSWWSSIISSSPPLEVVIVVRGTKTISDAITDLLMEVEEYRGGTVHAGIVEAGRWLAERHGDLCQELLELSNNKKKSKINVTLIGHSLGAGAAAIAGMELKDKTHIINNVKVVGFGCPALLSKDLSESTKDFITTVICDSDIVPRMSGATMANVALDVMEYDRYPKLLRDAQHAIDALGNYSPQIATPERRKAAMQYIEEASEDLKKKLQKPPTEKRVSPVLFPPGQCVHFYRDGHAISGSVAPCTFFGEIDITRTMVDDHLIASGYAKIFLDLMRKYHNNEQFSFDDKDKNEKGKD